MYREASINEVLNFSAAVLVHFWWEAFSSSSYVGLRTDSVVSYIGHEVLKDFPDVDNSISLSPSFKGVHVESLQLFPIG